MKDVKQVTHDTKLFLVEFPPLTYVSVPVGHHVYIRKTIEGIVFFDGLMISIGMDERLDGWIDLLQSTDNASNHILK